MRLGLIPVSGAGIVAVELIGEAVAQLHAQGAGKRDRRREIETISGHPAAQQIPYEAAMIRRSEASLLRQEIPGAVEVILHPRPMHRRLRLSIAMDRLPAFEHPQAVAAWKRHRFDGRTQPPFPVLHIEMTAGVMSAAFGVEDRIRD